MKEDKNIEKEKSEEDNIYSKKYLYKKKLKIKTREEEDD